MIAFRYFIILLTLPSFFFFLSVLFATQLRLSSSFVASNCLHSIISPFLEVTLVILISMSAVVASIAIIGLFGILRDNLAVIICFSCLMQVVFVASFMVPARIKPWSIVTVACCSICGFIFAYFLRRNHYLASLQVPNVLYQAEHNLKS